MFKGVFTALITPFMNGDIDWESLAQLIDLQLKGNIQGLVVCGTTGESATLTEEEQFKILDFVCDRVANKIPILFGSGTNNTSKTIELSKKACERDIAGVLVVVPYYNKPTQQGLIAHFSAVADNVNKPVVLYNVPGRTVTSLAPESVVTLAQHPNIVGIKEADADLNNFSKYKHRIPDDFSLLSGDDESCINFCLLGGHGVISVCSHVAPQKMVEWVTRALEKEESVRDEFRQQQRWISSLYISSNPVPVKYALSKRSIIGGDEVRLPLVTMDDTLKAQQDLAFQDFKELS